MTMPVVRQLLTLLILLGVIVWVDGPLIPALPALPTLPFMSSGSWLSGGYDVVNVAVNGFVFLVMMAVYGLPSFVAAARHKCNAAAIFTLNMLLGWTMFGWVLALVWAMTVDVPAQHAAATQEV